MNLTNVEAIDTAGLQLVLAFVQEARGQGKQLEWSELPLVVAESIDLLGMASRLGLDPATLASVESCPSM